MRQSRTQGVTRADVVGSATVASVVSHAVIDLSTCRRSATLSHKSAPRDYRDTTLAIAPTRSRSSSRSEFESYLVAVSCFVGLTPLPLSCAEATRAEGAADEVRCARGASAPGPQRARRRLQRLVGLPRSPSHSCVPCFAATRGEFASEAAACLARSRAARRGTKTTTRRAIQTRRRSSAGATSDDKLLSRSGRRTP